MKKSGTADAYMRFRLFVINDDNTYTITFDLTFGDTYRYTGSYTGEIEGIPISTGEQIEVTLDYAEKIGSSDGAWFNLRFYNEDSSIILFAYLYVSESYIPAGTYTPGYSAGNFAQYNTYMLVGDNQYAYTSGDIVVELADDNTYTFTFNNMDFNGISVNTSWTGKIAGIEKPQETSVVFTSISYLGNVGGWGSNTYQLTNEDGWQLNLYIDDDHCDPLQAGTYVSASYCSGGFQYDNYDTKLTIPASASSTGERQTGIKMPSGSIDVALDGTIYTININTTLSTGELFKGTYVGTI